MRTRELLLFLLLLSIVFAFRSGVPALAPAGWTWPSSGPVRTTTVPAAWRYDTAAPYYSYLPPSVRALHSPRPAEVADEVCKAMGGRLDFMQRPQSVTETLGFNCRFHEPDLTISADFGELRRTPAPDE